MDGKPAGSDERWLYSQARWMAVFQKEFSFFHTFLALKIYANPHLMSRIKWFWIPEVVKSGLQPDVSHITTS